MSSKLRPDRRQPMRTESFAASEDFLAPNGSAARTPKIYAIAEERAFREAEQATRDALMDCYNS